MKKRLLSLALAAVLALGLAVPALAAGQTFSDVPSSYWGYADIEAVAEAGLMKGTGGNQFSPEVKVSVAQFLTLLGRLVFPDVKTEGSDWFGPYVTSAKDAGLLNGTQVDTGNVEAEISRYDMAVILRAAAKKLGVAEKSAQSSEVKDFGMVPTMYADAVLAVYGMGLIKGDQAGNFNGSNTMMRAEVATVIMRLKKATGNQGSTTTDHGTEPDPTKPEKPADPDDDWEYSYARSLVPNPYDPDEVELKQGEDIWIYRDFMALDAWGKRGQVYLRVGDTLQLTVAEIPAGYNYTKADVQWFSDDESIAQVDENGLVTVVGEGMVWIDAKIPVIYYGDIWTTKMDRITLYCESK